MNPWLSVHIGHEMSDDAAMVVAFWQEQDVRSLCDPNTVLEKKLSVDMVFNLQVRAMKLFVVS